MIIVSLFVFWCSKKNSKKQKKTIKDTDLYNHYSFLTEFTCNFLKLKKRKLNQNRFEIY